MLQVDLGRMRLQSWKGPGSYMSSQTHVQIHMVTPEWSSTGLSIAQGLAITWCRKVPDARINNASKSCGGHTSTRVKPGGLEGPLPLLEAVALHTYLLLSCICCPTH